MMPAKKACIIVTMGAAIILKDHRIEPGPSPLNPQLTAIGSTTKQFKHISGKFYGLKKFTGAGNEENQAAEDSLRIVI
ncbi:hypothetical protein REPUB_Repub11eG0072600 [Reevesia pubescens]